MLHILSRNKLVFGLYICLLIFALAWFAYEGKIDSQIMINNLHTDFLDGFFSAVTFMGDGLFVVLVSIAVLVFISIRYGTILLSSIAGSSIIVQFLKKMIFDDFERPMLFFKNIGTELYRIEGYEYHSHFSFPSGHSTSAFALFIGLALFSQKTVFKVIFLFAACMISFSRTYLSQHFVVDIAAGSFLGTLTVLLLYWYCSAGKRPVLPEKSLFKYIKKV